MNDITHLLSAIERGDPQGRRELLPLVYDELRRLADRKLARRSPARPCRPRRWSTRRTSGWSTPAGSDPGTIASTSSAAAVEAMRRILIDRARDASG